MFLPLSVCLSVCPLEYLKSYERILMTFWSGWAWPNSRVIRNNRLDFGGDPDHDPPDPDSRNFMKDSLFSTAIPTDSQE